MLELDIELCPYCGMKILPEVEFILGRPERDRRMEEPRRSEVHPAEEFPVSLQFRIEDIVV
jgi:DNA-directed RNA polymerase subunit RPC12/RpoP